MKNSAMISQERIKKIVKEELERKKRNLDEIAAPAIPVVWYGSVKAAAAIGALGAGIGAWLMSDGSSIDDHSGLDPNLSAGLDDAFDEANNRFRSEYGIVWNVFDHKAYYVSSRAKKGAITIWDSNDTWSPDDDEDAARVFKRAKSLYDTSSIAWWFDDMYNEDLGSFLNFLSDPQGDVVDRLEVLPLIIVQMKLPLRDGTEGYPVKKVIETAADIEVLVGEVQTAMAGAGLLDSISRSQADDEAAETARLADEAEKEEIVKGTRARVIDLASKGIIRGFQEAIDSQSRSGFIDRATDIAFQRFLLKIPVNPDTSNPSKRASKTLTNRQKYKIAMDFNLRASTMMISDRSFTPATTYKNLDPAKTFAPLGSFEDDATRGAKVFDELSALGYFISNPDVTALQDENLQSDGYWTALTQFAEEYSAPTSVIMPESVKINNLKLLKSIIAKASNINEVDVSVFQRAQDNLVSQGKADSSTRSALSREQGDPGPRSSSGDSSKGEKVYLFPISDEVERVQEIIGANQDGKWGQLTQDTWSLWVSQKIDRLGGPWVEKTTRQAILQDWRRGSVYASKAWGDATGKYFPGDAGGALAFVRYLKSGQAARASDSLSSDEMVVTGGGEAATKKKFRVSRASELGLSSSSQPALDTIGRLTAGLVKNSPGYTTGTVIYEIKKKGKARVIQSPDGLLPRNFIFFQGEQEKALREKLKELDFSPGTRITVTIL